MLNLRQMQKKKQEELSNSRSSLSSPSSPSSPLSPNPQNITPAQIRIQKDLNEIQLPKTIQLKILEPQSQLKNFEIVINPDEGYYAGGIFRFNLTINNNFPIDPPKVKCLSKVYHPNINLEGNICLNILREDWSPVLNLNSILVGLLFLFLEPNATDPLNKEIAGVLIKDKDLFLRCVKSSMNGGTLNGVKYDYAYN